MNEACVVVTMEKVGDELDKAMIHYEERGQGRPLSFHGWTLDHRLELVDYEPFFEVSRRLAPPLSRSARHGSFDGQGRIQPGRHAGGRARLHRPRCRRRAVRARRHVAGRLPGAPVAVRRRASVAGLLLRMPCVIADTTRRTLPTFRPLVRDDALVATVPGRGADGLGQCTGPDTWLPRRRPAEGAVVATSPLIAATAPIVNEMRADPRRYGLSFDLAAEGSSAVSPPRP